MRGAVDRVRVQFAARSALRGDPFRSLIGTSDAKRKEHLTVEDILKAPAEGLVADDLRRYLVDTERKAYLTMENIPEAPTGGFVEADNLGRNLEGTERKNRHTIENILKTRAGGLVRADDLGRHLEGTERKKHLTIEDILKTPAGGVGADDLRRYLEDPMIDDEVREDERKRGATVEHMKLLRNRLETTLARVSNTTDAQLKQLAKECAENKKEIADMKRMLQDILNVMQATQRLPADDQHSESSPADVQLSASPPAGVQRSAKARGTLVFGW